MPRRLRHLLVLAGPLLLAAALAPPAGAVTAVGNAAGPDGAFAAGVRPGQTGIAFMTLKRRGPTMRLGFAHWAGGGRVRATAPFTAHVPSTNDQGAAALTRSGGVAVVSIGAHRFRGLVVDGRRRRVRSQVISHGGHPTRDEPTVVAGGDAAGAWFLERAAGGRYQPEWAYKPAGSHRFLRTRPLDTPHAFAGERYAAALGPDGSGIFVAHPLLADDPGEPIRVRRLGKDGSIGPWMTMGAGRYSDGSVALGVGPDGTAALAFSITGRPSGDPAAPETTDLLTSSLTPLATSLSPVQVHTTASGDALPDETLQVSVDRHRHVLVAATAVLDPADDSRGVLLLEGPPGALRETGRFEADQPGIVVTHTADGGATVAWTATRDDYLPSPAYATHHRPGGPWQLPRVVARSHIGGEYSEVGLISLTPLGRDRAVLWLSDSDLDKGGTRLRVLRP